MVRTANQNATVLTKTVIIETDAMIQKGVIISHFMREDIYLLKLFNITEIENKSHFMFVSSITEKPSSTKRLTIKYSLQRYLDDKNMIEKRRNEFKSLSRNIFFMNSSFLFFRK